MKIAYITSSFPYGKGEAFLQLEMEGLVRRGAELIVVPMRPKEARPRVALRSTDRITIVKMPLLSFSIIRGAIVQTVIHPIRTAAVLGRIIRSGQGRTVVKNLAVLPKGLWLAGKLSTWEVYHMHAHWASSSSTMAWVAASVNGTDWSLTAHRGDIFSRNMLDVKARSARFVRFIAEDGVAIARRLYGKDLPNVQLLHMGVPIPPLDLPAATRINGPLTILCPAALMERKGQMDLLRAAATLRSKGCSFRVLFTGDGPDRARLAAFVEKNGLAVHVEFLGWLPYPDLIGMYTAGSVDVVVLPSLHEGIPVALLEAMSFGVPVIATDVGGIPELLADGAGTLVSPSDPDSLAMALQLHFDPTVRADMGASARRRVMERFDADSVAGRLLELFRRT